MTDIWLNKIHFMDCIKGMKEILPEKSIDVIVTSPPYNINIDYNSYDDNRPFSEYLDWIDLIAQGCFRVLKDNGSFFFNIGDRPSDELRSLSVAQRIVKHFKLQNTIHWVKSIAIPDKEINIGHYKPVNSQRYLNNSHEYIFHFSKTGDIELNKLAIGVPYADKSNIGRWKKAQEDLRGRGNQWFIPYVTVHEKKKHPAMFPIQLPEMCIKLHGLAKSKPLIILDPFMGAGTTALAAKKLGCNYVGFEIDPNYINLALEALKT
ncbi:MAG: site-specific DNA-methyltransferase [Candidatus Heimdallarchaeota archaeon]|nr:site-specific DNA-methyltransferase [Candidatus Heimdallarchaeota archaeon]MBY8994902.1 site-specific DNA-methyltransferase [Candidatus Heimdallarchaeota archaeon]